ncbi:hypothetical protein COK43_10380 [Bacillus cereus]|nr:hypothetical protein COK43_10380 [Bacillus cereus]PGQ80480.1 hypothetical protein COA15_19930 [Bacillus anthracis]
MFRLAFFHPFITVFILYTLNVKEQSNASSAAAELDDLVSLLIPTLLYYIFHMGIRRYMT